LDIIGIKHYLDLERVINSVLKCSIESSNKLNLSYKTITMVNLIKKAFILTKREVSFLPWPYKPSIASCEYKRLFYSFFLYTNTDSTIFMNPWFHEHDAVSFVLKILNPGDVFIDVGAHMGLYSLLAGLKVGTSGLVVAIEPNPLNALILRHNIKLNKLRNVHVIQKALGDSSEGVAELHFDIRRTGFSKLIEDRKRTNRELTVKVQMTTLDEIVGELGIREIKAIKIDTEGYDFKVLRGAIKTIWRTHYLIIEENSRTIRRYLHELGFATKALKPSGYLVAINKRFIDRR